jgi:hypothetical protein
VLQGGYAHPPPLEWDAFHDPIRWSPKAGGVRQSLMADIESRGCPKGIVTNALRHEGQRPGKEFLAAKSALPGHGRPRGHGRSPGGLR